MSHNERDRPIPVPTNPERPPRLRQPQRTIFAAHAARLRRRFRTCSRTSPHKPLRLSIQTSSALARLLSQRRQASAPHGVAHQHLCSTAADCTTPRTAVLCRTPAVALSRSRRRWPSARCCWRRGPSETESMRLTTSRASTHACRRTAGPTDSRAGDDGQCPAGAMSVEPASEGLAATLRACDCVRRRREGRPKGGGDGPDVLPGLPCH